MSQRWIQSLKESRKAPDVNGFDEVFVTSVFLLLSSYRGGIALTGALFVRGHPLPRVAV